MGTGVTEYAKRDQVHLGVISRTTAQFLVVNFQVRYRAARLTPPAVASQDLLAQVLI
jgi:hypothetical protein